jgi:hypothetical protein
VKGANKTVSKIKGVEQYLAFDEIEHGIGPFIDVWIFILN